MRIYQPSLTNTSLSAVGGVRNETQNLNNG
jgi:hypothetical protein